MMRDREISDVVRRKYGEIAERVDAGAGPSRPCLLCGSACTRLGGPDAWA